MNPSIAVITVCRNAKHNILDCMASVASQSIPVEHIIVDGASTDGTAELIAQNAGERIRWLSEPDAGMYEAMNKGIAMASSDIIGILNSDDTYAGEQVLADVVKVFGDKDVESCYGDLCYREPGQGITRYWRAGQMAANRFENGWMPPHPTFFVRRGVYARYGGFSTDLGTAADYEMMLRLLHRHRINTVYIPRVLVNMQRGGMSNASFLGRIRANRMDRRAWEVNGLKPRPWTLWLKPIRKLGQWFVRPQGH